jgi:hypothetical protein
MDALGTASALGNIVTSTALAAAGVFAFLLVIWPARPPLPRAVLWACAFGFVWLALDEGLELHDRAGRWLYHDHGVVAPGPVNHVDDLFLIAYMAVGAVTLIASMPVLLRHRGFLLTLIVAALFFAAATAHDAFGPTGGWTNALEEAGEAAGAIVLAGAFGWYAWLARPRARNVASPAAVLRQTPQA